MSGYLSDARAQGHLAAEDRRLRDWELTDLEAVLQTPQGRAVMYRIVFEIGNLESASFDPTIKDGVCAGMHMARIEGMRDVSRKILQEAQTNFPDLWSKVLLERLARQQAEVAQRDKIKTSAGDEQ